MCTEASCEASRGVLSKEPKWAMTSKSSTSWCSASRAFTERLLGEVQQGHRRPAVHGRAHPDRPAHRRPRAARGRARPGQDADRQDAGRLRCTPSSSASSSRPTCCPPTSSAPPSTTRATQEFTRQARPDLRQPRARRRDQPRAGQGAVGAARGDAGAAGHDRRRDPPAARARSSSWRRRTRSSRRAPTRCPRRSSTASC